VLKKKAKFFTDIIRHLLLFLYILAMLLEPQSYSLFYDAAVELIQSVFPSVDFICHGRNLNSRKIFLLWIFTRPFIVCRLLPQLSFLIPWVIIMHYPSRFLVLDNSPAWPVRGDHRVHQRIRLNSTYDHFTLYFTFNAPSIMLGYGIDVSRLPPRTPHFPGEYG
jgi:hypothetical protein